MRFLRNVSFRPPVVTTGLAAAMAAAGLLLMLLPVSGADPRKPAQTAGKDYTPRIAAASNEPQTARKRIRVPAGLEVSLFAAEPMLANPVCFCVDNKNRFYVAETFRLHHGVTDIRGHMDWLDDDLAARTVEEREAMMRKHTGKSFPSYSVDHDRIRLIEDRAGAGTADTATVFADGFHEAVDGIGAGLLARGDTVWFTCIPDLWMLKDTNGTGKADVKKKLQHGYGLHVGFLGHDLHGLRMGPDGRLYFSIGDRALHVVQGGKTVSNPDSGSVLRCEPDGSNLEIVATGLRNPQELVFDEYGNLWTGDNNADGGDAARLVYVVQGGDSGWRIGYQFLHSPTVLGPWNAEKVWHMPWVGQSASVVPPIAHVCSGPSGLTYDPGVTQLPDRYRHHFFLCDFRGGSGGSGVRSFAVKPKGAAFEMTDQHEMVWSVLATDCDFGTDGALYVSDWVEGWNQPEKGRLWKVGAADKAKDAKVLEVKKLLADGFGKTGEKELFTLLGHADQRVRQEAQFELVNRARGDGIPGRLDDLARDPHTSLLARLHAVWGLGQLARRGNDEGATNALRLVELTRDETAELRAQAAKLLGETALPAAHERLVSLLKDAEPRVRLMAGLSLGTIRTPAGVKSAVPQLLQLARDNADNDPYLRHAAVMGLVGSHDVEGILSASQDSSPAVRLAVLLALRRLGRPDVARFLDDADPRLVLEAARAVNDQPIPEAMPKLAALVTRTGLSDPLGYRVLNANFRLGGPDRAAAVARFAARADASVALRIEALTMLGDWAAPSGRDRVVGLWRPIQPRDVREAADALKPALGGIFSGPDKLRAVAAKLAAKLGIKEVGPVLLEMVTDGKRPTSVRVETLRALAALDDQRLDQAITAALADRDPRLRVEGLRAKAIHHPEDVMAGIPALLDTGDRVERQGAFSILGTLRAPEADTVLATWVRRAAEGAVPSDVLLDLLDAAAHRKSPEVKKALDRYHAGRPKADHLAKFRAALAGGDAAAGRDIFLHKTAVSCLRCHKVKEQGGDDQGGDVGPELSKVGGQHPREYLLESIVDPNKQIAKGFETTVVVTNDDKIVTGILKSEDDKEIRLMTAEGKLVRVPKAGVADRQRGKSAMPEDIVKELSLFELRDLVEYLSTLK